jgi:hypothetical protein
MIRYFSAFLEREDPGLLVIPEHVRKVLMEEAYRRSAEAEPDGVPKYRSFDPALESIAKSIAAGRRGEPIRDLRVKMILEHYCLI